MTKLVGHAPCCGHPIPMTYVGPNPNLQNRTALVMAHRHSQQLVCAQFHCVRTGLGYGWWAFFRDEFDKPKTGGIL